MNAPTIYVALAMLSALGGLVLLWRPGPSRDLTVHVFSYTSAAGYFRSEAYLRMVRASGLVLFLGSLLFALSVPEKQEGGSRRVGPNGRPFTVFAAVEVAAQGSRGLVVCIAEPGLPEAWDAVLSFGRLDESHNLQFMIVSSVKRFAVPVREPWLTATAFTQSPPGAWRLGTDALRHALLPAAVRVCVRGERPPSR